MKNNWPTKKLGEILDYEQPTKYIVRSTNYKKGHQTPVLTAGKSFILGYTDEKDVIFPKDKLPVIIFDDFTTASKFVDFPFKVKSSAMKILHPKKDLVDAKFVFYKMQTIDFKATQHKRYWISEYSKIEIPLPPLSEQRRIVKKIEKLFAKIDEASRLRAESSAASAALLPSALYHIFSRAEKENWLTKKLGEVAKVFAGSSAPQSVKYFENGKYPFVRVSDLNGGKTKYLTNARDQINELAIQELRLTKAKKGSILFPKSGAAILTNSRVILGIDAYVVSHLAVVEVDEAHVLSDYIFFFLSNFDMSELVNDPAYPSLRLSDVKNLEIPLPPLSEQKKIVAYLDALSAKTRELQNLQAQTAANFSALRQSILTKVFNGEL
jgi:type I restriction enzyme S subunit